MPDPLVWSLIPTHIGDSRGSAPIPHPRSSHAAGLSHSELTAQPSARPCPAAPGVTLAPDNGIRAWLRA